MKESLSGEIKFIPVMKADYVLFNMNKFQYSVEVCFRMNQYSGLKSPRNILAIKRDKSGL